MDNEESTNNLPAARGPADVPARIDVALCEREPIHLPGSIQPYGVLFAFREADLTFAQVSANSADILGVEADELLGAPASHLLDAGSVRRLQEAVDDASAQRVGRLDCVIGGAHFDGIVYRSEGLTVLEIEPGEPGGNSHQELLDRSLSIVDRLQSAPLGSDLGSLITEEIRWLTGFDRTMLYRFHEDGHGEVIAEACPPDMVPYLHLHYPASDIPAQARQLYVLNRSRQIVDRDSRPVPIVPVNNPLTGRPLDLSLSMLRSISPVHIDYLRNMGVRSSMSISLVRGGALWGLIACHHRSPRRLSYRRRRTCELLGQVLSWQLVTKEQQEHAEARLRVSLIESRLSASMVAEKDVARGLSEGDPNIADFLDSGGAAIRCEGRWRRLGDVPCDRDLDEIGAWVWPRCWDGVYATDRLSKEQPAFERVKDVASGVLAIGFQNTSENLVIWFRPEVVKTVRWGGDPSKAVQPVSGEQRLAPRASFAAWKELVGRQSLPWRGWEIEAAHALRGAIVNTVLSRSAELEMVNRELRGAVRMRDDFMSMASHELRTPLFTLALQTDGLVRSAMRQPDAFTADRALPRLEVARRQVRRLEQLIGGLLDFSRISAGRLSLDLEAVSLSQLIGEVIARFADDLSAAGCTISLHLEPNIVGRWDFMRLDQVVTNLLSNAIKYGAGKPIDIVATASDGLARITVTDHGIGIDPGAQARIFERFERAVSPGHYSGFGLGLWIARHVMDQLSGRIEVTSAPGVGSTFVVTLPLAGPADPAPGGDIG